MSAFAGKRAQAGLEYMMTYGWALVLFATIIGVLVFVITPSGSTTTCSGSTKFIVKSARADIEKIQVVFVNATGTTINGYHVFADQVYDSSDSPPLLQINAGDATVGGTTNSTLSNDFVINFIEHYQEPMAKQSEKAAIVPWPVSGFGGEEFGNEAGKEGCNFFTESLGKNFHAIITVYYRDQFNLVREEKIRCTGEIQPAAETYFPQEAWGC